MTNIVNMNTGESIRRINNQRRHVKQLVIIIIVLVTSMMITQKLLDYLVILAAIKNKSTANMISDASKFVREVQKVLYQITDYYSLMYEYLLKLSKILGLESRVSKITAAAGAGVTGKLTLNRLMHRKLSSSRNIIKSAFIGGSIGAGTGALLTPSQLNKIIDPITETLRLIHKWTPDKEKIEKGLSIMSLFTALGSKTASVPRDSAVKIIIETSDQLSNIIRPLMYTASAVAGTSAIKLILGLYKLTFRKKIAEAEYKKVIEFLDENPKFAQHIRNSGRLQINLSR